GVDTGVPGDVEQRLLDEVRHQAWIGAMGQHGRRSARCAIAQSERLQAHDVIAARLDVELRVDVAAGPGFYAGVEVQRAALARQLYQRDARHVDGQIQQKIAGSQQRQQRLAVILARQRGLQEFDAELLCFGPPRILGGDDGDAIRRGAYVTQDQRQDPLAYAAEADENDPA